MSYDKSCHAVAKLFIDDTVGAAVMQGVVSQDSKEKWIHELAQQIQDVIEDFLKDEVRV